MANLILLLSITIPMGIVLSVLYGLRYLRGRDKRRSPLTLKVLNLPGEGLRRAIEKQDDGFHENLALVMAIGPIFLATWLLIRVDRVIPDWGLVRFGVGDAAIALVGAGLLAWCTFRLIQHAHKLRLYKQGLAAELAVAQCLMPLMADGLAVFHDFPAEKFNIDHIVVGRSAVFAVETKSRKKPEAKGRQSARVRYDGEKLSFPTHAETRPIEQAGYQAQWLQKFLNSGVGDPVRVIPVVALPGWYVESRVSRPDVFVTNCHNRYSWGTPGSDRHSPTRCASGLRTC
ncbi:MAG: NERD domain-containing protein [Pseudomonadota bacterium]|nr:NERD domain-containing protein [Pseudomonadota bacterium]